MNLPNKLTVLRVLMIPVFVALYFASGIPHNYLWALIVFAAAAITDMLDGQIARKYGLITDFGALMDPLADKLLVMSAMLCFIHGDLVHAAIVVVLLSREFMVTSIRTVAASKGTVISADRWGKLKTVLQMLWICLGLLLLWIVNWLGIPVDNYRLFFDLLQIFDILTWIVLAVTALSGLNYLVKNRQLFADK